MPVGDLSSRAARRPLRPSASFRLGRDDWCWRRIALAPALSSALPAAAARHMFRHAPQLARPRATGAARSLNLLPRPPRRTLRIPPGRDTANSCGARIDGTHGTARGGSKNGFSGGRSASKSASIRGR
eukprot:5179055-Alexandrium_andersonii.AAC.1